MMRFSKVSDMSTETWQNTATPAHFGLSVGQESSSTFSAKGKCEVSTSSVTFIDCLYVFTTPGELCTASGSRVTVIDKCGQATKGAWWMSWHREATKDVVACDMLRGTGKRVLIRRFLNAETRLG